MLDLPWWGMHATKPRRGGSEMKTIGMIVTVAAVALMLAAPRTVLAQPSDSAIAGAKTAQDHEAIAQSYDDEAKALREKATLHTNQAKAYAEHQTPHGTHGSAAMEAHCKKLATAYTAAAKDADQLAAAHREMAKKAGK